MSNNQKSGFAKTYNCWTFNSQVDAWLEKVGMIDAWVVEIRVMHRLRDGKAFVTIGYCLRRKDGRYDRAADGLAKVDYVNIECDMPPLGFFLIEA